MDDWAANDPHFAKMIGWTSEPLPFTDTLAQIWSLGYAHGTLYADQGLVDEVISSEADCAH
jgi:hypothetical protein